MTARGTLTAAAAIQRHQFTHSIPAVGEREIQTVLALFVHRRVTPQPGLEPG
jgi:hypothetical protein